MKINLRGVKTEMETLPPGRYLCSVFKITSKVSQNGNAYLEWVFKVSPEHPDSDYVGRQLFHNTTLTKESLWNLKRLLIALGEEPADLDDNIDFEPDEYVGRMCVVEASNEMYQGIARARVSRILPEDAPLSKDGETVDSLVAADLI